MKHWKGTIMPICSIKQVKLYNWHFGDQKKSLSLQEEKKSKTALTREGCNPQKRVRRKKTPAGL
jgi:L,D-peptidoglycan transpeptidase YkuD (ErfK/YbiS/YcfS/YnhG family)